MAYIEVELDEFDTLELVEELTKRLREKRWLRGKDAKKAIEMMDELTEALHVCILPIVTVDDQQKRDVIKRFWSQLTSYQFEEKLSK